MTLSDGVIDPPALDESPDDIDQYCEADNCGRRIDPHNAMDVYFHLERRWCARCINLLLDSMIARAAMS